MLPTIQRYLHTVLALVLAVLLVAAAISAAEQPINFATAGTIKLLPDARSTTPSRAIAASTCKNTGGILLADYAPAVQEMFMEAFVSAGATYVCQSTSSGWNRNCYGAYTEGQATAIKDKCTLVRREQDDNAFDATKEAKICPYRWSLGSFSRFTNSLGQVGVNFYDSAWADLAFDGSDTSQIPMADYLRNYERMAADTSTLNIYAGGPANDYSQGVMWNASFQCFTSDPIATTMAACIPPHGQPYVALGARQLSGASGGYYGVRVDAPEAPTATSTTSLNSPFVPNNYVVACQWQGVEASYYASTTLPPQYPMVPDWKQPTWIQSHWWIIYLVVAVVLLALLVAFIVWYECKLRAAKPAADESDVDCASQMAEIPQSNARSTVKTLHGTETGEATTKKRSLFQMPGGDKKKRRAAKEKRRADKKKRRADKKKRRAEQKKHRAEQKKRDAKKKKSSRSTKKSSRSTKKSSRSKKQRNVVLDNPLTYELDDPAVFSREWATGGFGGMPLGANVEDYHGPWEPRMPLLIRNPDLTRKRLAAHRAKNPAPDRAQTIASQLAEQVALRGHHSPIPDSVIVETPPDCNQFPDGRPPEGAANTAQQQRTGGQGQSPISDSVILETPPGVNQFPDRRPPEGAVNIVQQQRTGGQGQPAQGARAAPAQIPAALPLPAANAASVRAPVPAVQAAEGTRAPAAQSQMPAALPAQGARATANPVNNQALNTPSDELYPAAWDSPVWDGYGSIHKPNDDDM